MQLRVIDTPEEAFNVKPLWQDLYQRAENAHIFLSPAWNLTWLDTYRHLISRLQFLCVFHSNGQMIAALPLYERKGEPFRLRFTGTGEPEESEVFSEYHDVLVCREHVDTVTAILIEAIKSTGKGLVLNNVKHDALLLRLADEAYPPSLVDHTVAQKRYFMTLEDDGLAGTKLKKKAKRYYNLFIRLGGQLHICSDPASLDAFYSVLTDLHRLRWEGEQQNTIFDDVYFNRFHQSLAGQLLKQGTLLLAYAEVGGKPVSAFYGMKSGDSVYFYQGGIDSGFSPNISPGTLIHYLMAEYAAGQGMKGYDFLSSGVKQSYKQSLTEFSEPVYSTTAYASGWQKLLIKALAFASGVARKAGLP